MIETRSQKKLDRALSKVSADRVEADVQGEVYTGRSEAAWKRRAYGWTRSGIHNESIKPDIAARRLGKEKRRQDEAAVDPDRADLGASHDNVRDDYRRYRRRQQERPGEGCDFVAPPRCAKRSSARKAQVRQNYKISKQNRIARTAAAKCFSQPSGIVKQLTSGELGNLDSKSKRRGGKTAKRCRAATQARVLSNSDNDWIEQDSRPWRSK